MKHIYEFTYETTALGSDTIIGSWEVRVEYTFSPGRPAVMYLRNGDPGYPEEGPEIEIADILVEDWPGPFWRTATQDEYERFSECALDDRFDDMVEGALNDRQDAEESAKEHAAEDRADLARTDKFG